MISTKGWWLIIHIGETAMCNHTQNPSISDKSGLHQNQQSPLKAEGSTQAAKKQKLQSVINMAKSINGKKAVICTALTGEQAISLVNALKDELNSPLFIKFAGMEVAK